MRTWAVLSLLTALTGLVCATTGTAHAAGLLKPVNTSDALPQIVEHAVKVVIDNGFARTEVRQVFHNANAKAIAARPAHLRIAERPAALFSTDAARYGASNEGACKPAKTSE